MEQASGNLKRLRLSLCTFMKPCCSPVEPRANSLPDATIRGSLVLAIVSHSGKWVATFMRSFVLAYLQFYRGTMRVVHSGISQI
jgi:hypothetical protein